MHLFLIRHGETEHNVAGLLAGVSDSRLTNHGVQQTQRLGRHLTTHRNLRFTHIYASDLQRASMTADEVQKSQMLQYPSDQVPTVVQVPLLREQDFGSLELVPWGSRRAQSPDVTDPSFRPQETSEAMGARAEAFLADFVIPLLAAAEDVHGPGQDCVAVVSHGLFLSALWRTLLPKFAAGRVNLGPNIEVLSYGRPLEYLPSWTNTGFLEASIIKSPDETPDADITKQSRPLLALSGYHMTILSVNSKDHLLDLKRARGGLGSAAYDARQQSLDGFFKRP